MRRALDHEILSAEAWEGIPLSRKPCLLSHHFELFFFHGCGDHRDQHSFPTRRSSDLRGGERGEPARGVVDRRAARVDVRDQDRKSTRLNSSHLVNSYAVFCLKKKKHAELWGDHAPCRLQIKVCGRQTRDEAHCACIVT